MKEVKKGSYNTDDGHYLTDFLEFLDKKRKQKKTGTEIETHVNIPPFKINAIRNSLCKLSMLKLNSLYNVCGYILNSITKMCVTCGKCVNSVISLVPIYLRFTKFVTLKCYKSHTVRI